MLCRSLLTLQNETHAHLVKGENIHVFVHLGVWGLLALVVLLWQDVKLILALHILLHT